VSFRPREDEMRAEIGRSLPSTEVLELVLENDGLSDSDTI